MWAAVGKGTVLENLGRGRYNIRLDLGSVRRQQLIDGLTFQIDELLAARADLYAAVVSARADHQTALDDYNAAVSLYVEWKRGTVEPDPGPDAKTPEEKLEEATQDLAEAGDALREAERELRQNESETRNLERKRERLERTPGTRDLQAWCPDRTDYLDPGDPIATLEVPNEPQDVLVAPGGATAQDSGDLMRTDFQVSYQAYYNAAILPGWQKTMPTYRFGTITAMNEDFTCNLNVTLAVSKAQGLSVSREDALQNVPILYRQCDAAAFKPGDEVVIEFRDRLWSSPRVIGFRENPPFCRGAFCRVTGSGQTRKAFPIDRGTTYAWYTPVVDAAFFGHIGWAGPDGSVSWDAWGAGWSRYVYHRNVDYGIMELFPELYWYNSGADHCYPVILGCFVMGDTIVVVVETQAHTTVGGEFVYQSDLYRLDVLGIKPRAFDAPMEDTERYVIYQIERDPLMYDTVVDMILQEKVPERFEDPPPVAKSFTTTTNCGAAWCQGFSIKPDGTQFVYCNHTGAYHVELDEAEDGTLTATHMMHPSMLEAWERRDFDFSWHDTNPTSVIRDYEYRKETLHVEGYAIVGAHWDEVGPIYIYYRADGDQVASVQIDRERFDIPGGTIDNAVRREVVRSEDTTDLYLRYTGPIDWQMGSYDRAFSREDEFLWERDPDFPDDARNYLGRTTLEYAYEVSGQTDEVEEYPAPGATYKAVEISPQTGLYVGDRIVTAGPGDAATTRLVVDLQSGVVLTASEASPTDELAPPNGSDPTPDMGDSPIVFPWFLDGFPYGPTELAPDESFGFAATYCAINPTTMVEECDTNFYADRYTGYWKRGVDPFFMNKLGRYWYRPIGVNPPAAFKSAEVRGAVFLSTDIDGTPFHYMSGVDSVAEQFAAEDPITFDYIVAG